MSVSKNLVQSGTWSVNGDDFAAGSSILWPLLIAAVYFVVGPNEATPLVLNVLSAVLLLVTSDRLLQRHRVPRPYRAIALVAIAFLTPLPAVMLGGMEHVLHAALTIALVDGVSQFLGTTEPTRPLSRRILLLSLLVSATRYEGLILVAVASVLMVVRRRVAWAGATLLAGATPVVLFGLAGLANGAYFLPNSVLLKATPVHLSSAQAAYEFLLHTPLLKLQGAVHLLVLLVTALVLLAIPRLRPARPWDERGLALLLFATTTWLHMMVAGIGWFYRYEAYLVCLGLLSITIALRDRLPTAPPRWEVDHLPKYAAVALAIVVVFVPLGHRGAVSLAETPLATNNIYHLPYQLARFFDAQYADQAVAVNDAGAVTYLASVRSLDLAGLSSQDVAEARLEGRFDTGAMRTLIQHHGSSVVVVYDSWFDGFGGVPPEWTRVGQWKLQRNVVAGDTTYSFYGPTPEDADRLRENLRAFSPRLPPELIQLGYLE